MAVTQAVGPGPNSTALVEALAAKCSSRLAAPFRETAVQSLSIAGDSPTQFAAQHAQHTQQAQHALQDTEHAQHAQQVLLTEPPLWECVWQCCVAARHVPKPVLQHLHQRLSLARQPSTPIEPNTSAQPNIPAQPSTEAQSQKSAEPNASAQPSCSAEPGAETKHDTPAQPSTSVEPSISTQPSCSIQPQISAQPSSPVEYSTPAQSSTSLPASSLIAPLEDTSLLPGKVPLTHSQLLNAIQLLTM